MVAVLVNLFPNIEVSSAQYHTVEIPYVVNLRAFIIDRDHLFNNFSKRITKDVETRRSSYLWIPVAKVELF